MSDIPTLMRSGAQHLQCARFAEAERCFREVLGLQPDYADALNLLAIARLRQGRADEAEPLLRDAIRFSPGHLGARNNLGTLLRDTGRLDESAVEFERMTALAPKDPRPRMSLAIVHSQRGRHDDARVQASAAVELMPGMAQPHFILGVVCRDAKDFAAARVHLEIALRLEPAHVAAAGTLSTVCIELEDFCAAETHARQALDHNPADASALHNLGIALAKQWRQVESIPFFEHATQLAPQNAMILTDYATAHYDLGHLDDATTLYEKALCIDPQFSLARFALSLLQLTRGDFASGWRNYAARRTATELKARWRSQTAPAWQGEPLVGKTMLLYAEQGLGDCLQFVRFVPDLIDRGAAIRVEVPAPLRALLQENHWPVVFQDMNAPAGVPASDYECSLIDIPMLLNIGVSELPGAAGYLHAPNDAVARWQNRLPADGRLRVGLCWAGSAGHKNNRNRSIPVELFAEICAGIDAQFVVLQQAPKASDVAALAAAAGQLFVPDAPFADMADTAALIDCLDLVITVDTVIAHLAGGLAKPVWVLIPHVPDWRWMLGRADSPWYPSMRLFRQLAPEHWPALLDQLHKALAQRTSEPKS